MNVFSHIEFQPVEDQRARIGGGGAWRVEVDLLALEVVERVDLRTDENMQFGGEQIEDVGDPLLDVGNQRLELLERVRVDDRGVHALEVEQRLHVLGRAAGDDGKHVQVVAIVHDAGDLGRETDRRAFQLTAGQPDGPGIELLDGLRLGGLRGICGSR